MAGLLDFLPTKEGLLSGYNRVNGLLEDAVRYTDPKRFVSPSDAASMLPGGGLVTAWQESGKGRDALKAGDYAGAAGAYGNMLLNMVPEGGAIAKLAIVPIAAARRTGISVNLPTDDVFKSAVANTPGSSVSPEDGLVMSVMRRQRPEQAFEPSVRGGVFYLPEGSAQAKHYSGSGWYGGAEKIAGETSVRNPLFVKGATGGKAPEAALDQLVGKGAYEAVRSDALKAIGGYGAKPADKIKNVQAFLEKHAPELADQADFIVENSKQGNQLAYALQEAAVASAVRKAGHDAVVGFSKGKQGPVISEIFDVRENMYPSRDGDFGVWPRYENP